MTDEPDRDDQEVPWIPSFADLDVLRSDMATAVVTDASQIRATFDASGVNYLRIDPHELLSKFLYDLARKIEARNMAVANEHQYEGESWEECGFLEELMGDIGKAPVSQEYAARLAFAPPRRSGIGPHKVTHQTSSEWAWCGGPGFCRLCDGVPNA